MLLVWPEPRPFRDRARVAALSSARDTRRANPAASCGGWIGICRNPGTRSGAEGSMEILVGPPTMVWSGRLFSTTHVKDPEEWVAALWVAPEGQEPVIVRVEEGRFREREEGEAAPVWGTYDLGTVQVPVGRAASPLETEK